MSEQTDFRKGDIVKSKIQGKVVEAHERVLVIEQDGETHLLYAGNALLVERPVAELPIGTVLRYPGGETLRIVTGRGTYRVRPSPGTSATSAAGSSTTSTLGGAEIIYQPDGAEA